MIIFYENNYFFLETFFPPREFINIERKGKLQNCKKSTSIIKPSIERVFSDLPMVFADKKEINITGITKEGQD